MCCLRGHGPHRGFFRGAIEGARIWWVAPSYPQIEASEIWPNLKKAAEPIERFCEIKELTRSIRFPGGGSIEVKSADSDVRGAGLDGLVLDEAAFIEEATWTKVLRPTLTDRKGWCMMLTTPNGMNWWRDLFHKSAGRIGWQAWQRPSSDNPLMTTEELADAEWEMGPQAFSQEHLAQFTDMEGAGFPGEYFEGDLFFDDWPDSTEIVWRAVAIDPSLGRTEHSDYSAIVSIALRKDGVMFVDADLERRPPAKIIEATIGIVRDFAPHAIGIETNGFQEMMVSQMAAQAHVSNCPLPPIECIVNSSATKKTTRVIMSLDPYLAPSRREFRFRRSRGGALLLKQLRAFPNKDEHDDGPDAMEMCLYVIKKLYRGEIEV